jgi:hemin uptake protein HemP
MTPASEAGRRLELAPAAASAPRPAVRSDDLFRGTHEIVIVHRGDEYRLRITRAGKLILTK